MTFHRESERNQHHRRSHLGPKKMTTLKTKYIGFYCKVCGEGAKEWKDSRGLKRHYMDRSAHSVKEVLKAGVNLWVFDGLSILDKIEMRDWFEDRQVIEEKGTISSDDDDFVLT